MKNHTIDYMQKLANDKNGKCLSKKYTNTNTKLKWQCKKGHVWWATPNNIKRETWCPICAGTIRGTIDEMQKLAKNKNGKCLSKKYINNRTKLKWQCKKDHIWWTTPTNITIGHWCHVCAGWVKGNIEELQQIAQSKGGKCLSKRYTNSKTKLKWQCKNGHTWNTEPSAIKMGKWCPICSSGINERISRKLFETIFNEKFPKSRPTWLMGPKGLPLELDGYSEKLNLAFEYQGEQHYAQIPFFHSNRNLDVQKKYDALKRKLCKKHKVILLEIPAKTQIDEISKYIIQECNKRKVDLPKKIPPIFTDNLYIYPNDELKELKTLAKQNGGKCISNSYFGANAKLSWQCNNGHIWTAKVSHIKKGHWCPFCIGRGKTIKDMDKLAKLKNGKCLSKKYVNAITKLRWLCAKGHQWNASPNAVQNGSWCPVCGGSMKLTIKDAQRLARIKGGQCLSTKYVNSRSKYSWRCAKGHEWKTTHSSIKQGGWCPTCAHKTTALKLTKYSINYMQKIAKKHKGKCLSQKWVNTKTKLKWQCKKGHVWETTPASVIFQNCWCPICGYKTRALKKTRYSIDYLQKIAKKHGGKCLSKKYVNTTTKLKWKCSKGHIWKATSSSLIYRNTWCLKCFKQSRKTPNP